MVSFELGVAVLAGIVLYFVYRGSVDLDAQRHWIIRMFLFYGAVALGWAMLNVALLFASDGGASTLLYDSLQNVYYAYSIVATVLVFYAGWNFFTFTFYKFLAIARRGQESKESEQAW